MEQLEHNTEYKKFFEDTPIAFIRTSIATGEILMANSYAAKMLGYDSKEKLIENCNVNDLYAHKEDRKKLIQQLMNKENHKYEVKFALPNGSVIWAEAHLHINCGGSCIEGSLIDITDQKNQEQQVCKQGLQQLSDLRKKIDQALRATA